MKKVIVNLAIQSGLTGEISKIRGFIKKTRGENTEIMLMTAINSSPAFKPTGTAVGFTKLVKQCNTNLVKQNNGKVLSNTYFWGKLPLGAHKAAKKNGLIYSVLFERKGNLGVRHFGVNRRVLIPA